MVKLAKYKDKEKILKAAMDKQATTYKGRPIRVMADLSTETWQARKECYEIFNVMNRKNMQQRILYPASLSFRIVLIKLTTGCDKSREESRESMATEIKGLRNSHKELHNAINEVQNKMDVAIARIEEAEGRIGELEDKIM